MKHSGMVMIKVSVQLLCWMEIFHSKDESLSLNKGDTAFIDAGSGKVNISGEGEFIFTRV